MHGSAAPPAGDAGPDVVEQAGDALLPLLQSDPAAFASLGQALVQVRQGGRGGARCGWYSTSLTAASPGAECRV